jgi:hypothetical protein
MSMGIAVLGLLFVLIVEKARKGSLIAVSIFLLAATANAVLLGGLFYLFYLHGSVLFMGITIGIVVVTLLADLLLKWLMA